jgi:hypothetical protein
MPQTGLFGSGPGPQEIPLIADKIDEDRDLTVWFTPRRRAKLDTCALQSIEHGVKVVCVQEERDSTTGLVSYRRPLPVTVCSS